MKRKSQHLNKVYNLASLLWGDRAQSAVGWRKLEVVAHEKLLKYTERMKKWQNSKALSTGQAMAFLLGTPCRCFILDSREASAILSQQKSMLKETKCQTNIKCAKEQRRWHPGGSPPLDCLLSQQGGSGELEVKVYQRPPIRTCEAL